MPSAQPPKDRASGRASVPGRARMRPPQSATSTAKRSPAVYGAGAKPRPPQRKKGGPKPRWDRIGLVVVLVVALCGGLSAFGAWLYATSLDGDLGRTDPFSALTGGRPPKTVQGVQNILLVGSDSRDPDAQSDAGSNWRADTVIVLHIPSTQDRAYLISVPRDLYVAVPKDPGAKECGNRRAKINAAYAWGGLPLLVKSVECLTSLPMDHVIMIDFGGFIEVVDALGGVDMNIERTITSIHQPKRTFAQGLMHLNGAEALDYVRQRKQFPDGDFARMRHQQQLMRTLLDKAASSQTLTSPGKLSSFLDAATGAITVDKGFSLVDMALQFRNLRSDDLTFVTSPHRGTTFASGEDVVVHDQDKAAALYRAMGSDSMATWLKKQAGPSPSANNVR